MRVQDRPDPADGLSLFAFDPGGTTGVAEFQLPFENLFQRDAELLDGMQVAYNQLTGTEGVQAMEVQDLLRKHIGPVIIEGFVLRQFNQDADLLSPVRMTARIEQVIDMLNWERGCGDYMRHVGAQMLGEDEPAVPPWNAWREIRVRKQPVEIAMSTATDDRLKDWGLWATGAPHARDAMRHGITFLRRAKTDERLRRWGWPELAESAA